jgi:hypothetical protein
MDFSYLTFSIFDVELPKLCVALSKMVDENNKFLLEKINILPLEHKQLKGGNFLLNAIFYEIECCKGKTVMISNSIDGWMTLCNKISYESSFSYYNFKLSRPNIEEYINSFAYYCKGVNQRTVYVMKDAKWFFYEYGEPLWFENIMNYKKRIIRNRLDYNILISYCMKLGIDILDDSFFYSKKEAFFLKQASW